MDILEGLNPQQRLAVGHDTGPMLVVAGAGTGKTQVITRRIAYLIAQGKAKPTQILALTFTEKAAREMADRLYELIGWEAFSVPVMTFNAFGAKLLQEYGFQIGRSTRGGLINDTQKALLLQQRLSEFKLEYYTMQPDWFEFATQLVRYIGRLQNVGVTVEQYQAYVDGLLEEPGEFLPADIAEQRDLVAVYSLYEAIKHETATFDYYDQLAVPIQILQCRPNLAMRIGRQYGYVLVDEYQDTSPVQDALLRQLVGPGGNIFAVGDDDQAIYGFRGADITNILSFTEHFKAVVPVALIQNYRSGQAILDAAYRLIVHNNPDRLEARLGIHKRLVAQKDKVAQVKFVSYRVAAEEQSEVVAAIARRWEAGEQLACIAILARSNATLQSYARELRARHLPFAISTEINIFEQRELIQLWHLMEWIGYRASDEAMTHVALGPLVGWEAARWRRVVERATVELISLEEALEAWATEGDELSTQLVEQLRVWRTWAAEESATRLVFRLATESTREDVEPLMSKLQRMAKEEGRLSRVMRVIDDLQRFMTQIDLFVEAQELSGGDKSLAGFLAQFPRPPRFEVSETVGEAEGVQLLTIHASKGLEFDTVYLVNTTAKAWNEPSSAGALEVPAVFTTAKELPSIHEQRRLMYVAVTRARQELWISAPAQTAGGQRQAVSPLVAEVLGEEPEIRPMAGKGVGLLQSMRKLQRFYPLQSELPDRLPFEATDGWLELAVGDLELYGRSPHDFYLEKVLRISRPFGPQLAFGVAIHRTIERFYKAQLEETGRLDLDELMVTLDQLWSDHGYDTRVLANTAHDTARQTIRRFYEREMRHNRQVRSSEQVIRLEVPEAKLRLRGRIDATFAVEGGLEIRDFKTGRQLDALKVADKAKTSFQLRTYALALEALTGKLPAQVTLDYVVTGVEGTAELSPLILKNHRKKLIELAERVRARDFDPGKPSTFHTPAAFRYYGEDEEEWPDV